MNDEAIIGVWVNEQQINSPGGASGFASFSTVMIMELNADGTVRQMTQGVGGGADWSSDSGRRIDFEGQWKADGQTLFVMGMGLPEFRAVGTYRLVDSYLVTQSDMGRLIWQRRG